MEQTSLSEPYLKGEKQVVRIHVFLFGQAVRPNHSKTKLWGLLFLTGFVCAFSGTDLSAQQLSILPLPPPQLAAPSSHPSTATETEVANDFASEFRQAYQHLAMQPDPLPNSIPSSELNLAAVEIVDAPDNLTFGAFDQPATEFVAGNFVLKGALDSEANGNGRVQNSETNEQNISQGFQFDTDNRIQAIAELDVDRQPIWWQQLVGQPLMPANETQTVDTNSLVFAALKNSPRIQAISQTPMIREMQVIEAASDFDPISFVRSNFDDRNDPVGNTLTTGGAPFLKDNIWSGEFGLRKKTWTGGSVELSERLGFKNSNSTFFVPQDQGTATLALNVTQPLLRGSGRYYNQAQILIAQSAGGAAWDTFTNELQDELQSITQAYWHLYYDRSSLLQKQRNVERGERILAMLEGRSELDSLPSQIARARSAVQTRRTDLANALRDVRNSETQIRRRIADRDWLTAQNIELLPTEPPVRDSLDIPLDKVVYTALEQRREIKEVIQRAKIACVQRDISSNELMPELSLLLGTYVSGLKGGSALGQAMVQQFDVSPGYNVGIQFEMPYMNRAARSRLAQQKLQVAKIKAEVDETVQTVIAESQIALRRVNAAFETLNAAEQAIVAARADLDQNQHRWEAFALVEGDLADGQNPTTILNQVLDAQERLTAAELTYSQSEFELKIAEVGLQSAMGTLLMHENINYQMIRQGDNPELHLEKGNPVTGPSK